jgi:hypothetical protein
MHIQAFHRKFTSKAESGNLFQALRKLSLADNFKSMFSADGDVVEVEWVNWPPMGVNAACEA